jgi:hypothetical protein
VFGAIIPSSGHSIGSRRWNLWPASRASQQTGDGGLPGKKIAFALRLADLAVQIIDHLVCILDRRFLVARREQLARALRQLLLPGASYCLGSREPCLLSSCASFARVAGRQTQNTETGPHTLLDMITPGQQPPHISRYGHATLTAWWRTQSGVRLATALCAGGMCSPNMAQFRPPVPSDVAR